jgi:hypothetical protein
MVTFQIWKEGQDPASHIAQSQIVKDIAGGVAKARFSYTLPAGEKLPERDPKWFFTVHSAWCAWKKSGMIEVELKRPELSEAKWTDTDGKDTDKGLVGAAVKLGVTCNKDTEEGAGVTFKVYRDGADPKRDQVEEEIASRNQGGKAEAEWTYHYKHDPENPLKEKPKFFFTAVGKRCQEVKSGNVEMGQYIYVQLLTQNGMIIAAAKGRLISGETVQDITIADGYFESKDYIPGDWRFYLGEVEGNADKKGVFKETGEDYHIVRKPISVLTEEGIRIPKGEKKLAIVLDRKGYST